MTFLDFFEYCINNTAERKERKGMFMMNALYYLRKDIYDKIIENSDRKHNPYYHDTNIPYFWEFVVENWRKDNA